MTQPSGTIEARLTASEYSMCHPSRRKGTPQIMSPTVVGKNNSPAQRPQR